MGVPGRPPGAAVIPLMHCIASAHACYIQVVLVLIASASSCKATPSTSTSTTTPCTIFIYDLLDGSTGEKGDAADASTSDWPAPGMTGKPRPCPFRKLGPLPRVPQQVRRAAAVAGRPD